MAGMDVINPNEPFRMPDQASIDAWRNSFPSANDLINNANLGGGSDYFGTGNAWTNMHLPTIGDYASAGDFTGSTSDSYSNPKFNGWMNYFTGGMTGAPAGSTGGLTDQPIFGGNGSQGSGASNVDWGKLIADYFVRGGIVVLGFVFVGAGLHLFGVTSVNPVSRVVSTVT